MKIAVYSIAKNEEKFTPRWAASAADADYRIVLDTGSTDNTVSALRAAGVTVHQKAITPWRFDTARNEALALVPQDADVCISLDLDEVLVPGWRKALEHAWTSSTTLLRYPFVSTWKADGITPNTTSYGFKIHARHGYRWHYAIHEILRPLGAHKETFTTELKIEQYQDPKKDRSHFRKTLEELTKTEPDEPRYHMYLGRDYFDAGLYEKAIEETEKFVASPTIADPRERAFGFRVLAWSHGYLGHSRNTVIQCLLKAVAESPNEREPWVHLAIELAEVNNWPNCFSAAGNALAIKRQENSYIVDQSVWGPLPQELFLKSGRALGIPDAQLSRFLSHGL